MEIAKFRFTILPIILMLTLGCKSKYEKAYEEFIKREYYISPEPGDESKEEIELLSNAIKFNSKLPALFFYRAEQYKLFGEYEKAINDYKICIEHNWIFGNLFYQKGNCELKLKNYNIANSDFKTSKELVIKEWNELPNQDKKPNHWGSPYFEHQEMIEKLENKIKLTSKK